MRTDFYASVSWLSGGLRARLATLAAALLLAPAAWAQIEVPAGNPNGFGGTTPFKPLGTYFGYERSAMIYTAAEIGTSGNLTQVGFYVSSVSTPGATPTKIYLKTVANATFAAATTVAAEEAGATLVYDATIPAASFVANTWVSVPLTAPFAYNGTANLEVIVETNATGEGNERVVGKAFRYATTGTGNSRMQFWQADNVAPAIAGRLSLFRPNIQLTGLTPLACPPVDALAIGSITMTSAQISFTPGAGSNSYTVTYTPVGGTATTVTPAPTASPISLTGLTAGTIYTVTVTGNCTGNATSLVASTTFATSPVNDNCATATALAVGTTCTPTTITNLSATASTGAPAPTAPITGCFLPTIPISNDVWYSLVAPASGSLTVTTSPVAGSPVTDTGLLLYTGTCGTLTEVACNDDDDDEGFFSQARVSGLTPGATIYARVWSFGTTPTGQFGLCAVAIPTNDAAVQTIYSLGKAPVNSAQVVQAVVSNVGAAALTNVPVTLTVAGVTTFTDAKIIPTLAPGASATVTFAAFTTTATGNNTLTVTLPADGGASNNTQAYTQIVNANTFSYANNAVLDPDLSVGSPAANTAAFVVRYNTSAARTLTSITVALADANTVGRTLYGVVLSSTGTVLARTPDYVVVAADIDQRKTFALATPLVVAAGDFYVGLIQTAVPAGGARYFPLSTLPQTPTRPGTFFTIAAFSPTTGGTLADAAASGLGIFVIEAQVNTILGTSAALNRAINMFPNPSNGLVTLEIRDAKAKGAMQVEISNALGQIVHTAALRDNAENQLNLSGLANGLYVLRVKSGSEYTIRQLVLTK